MPSEFGELLLVAEEGTLARIGWTCLGAEPPAGGEERLDLMPGLVTRILETLAGADHSFGDVPLGAGTAFQRACWRGARRIPMGGRLTYGALAEAVGSPRASRAVGQALRMNPLPIVTPCHRVVAANGGPGGFCGEGREGEPGVLVKMRLLANEQKWIGEDLKRRKPLDSRMSK